MNIKARVVTALKSRIVQNVGPIRRLTERNLHLESEVARLNNEVIRLKRELGLIGDQHRLYHCYADALAECETPEGYDAGLLSRYIVRKSKEFLRQLDGLSPVDVPDHVAQSLLVALLVAQQRNALRVIDFGGGCAVPVAILERMVGDSLPVDWHVVELPSLVAAARGQITIPHVTFSASLDEAVTELGTIDLIHAAGALQCVDDPRAWLARLLAVRATYLFIGRTGFSHGTEDVIGIQRSRIRDHGMQVKMRDEPDGFTEYPFTYMRKDDFDAMMDAGGYKLVATLDSSSGYRPINDQRITGGAFLYRHAEANSSR